MKRKPKVVWLMVSTLNGVGYGGEWELRRKDAIMYAKVLNQDDGGRVGAPAWKVQKAVLVD